MRHLFVITSCENWKRQWFFNIIIIYSSYHFFSRVPHISFKIILTQDYNNILKQVLFITVFRHLNNLLYYCKYLWTHIIAKSFIVSEIFNRQIIIRNWKCGLSLKHFKNIRINIIITKLHFLKHLCHNFYSANKIVEFSFRLSSDYSFFKNNEYTHVFNTF